MKRLVAILALTLVLLITGCAGDRDVLKPMPIPEREIDATGKQVISPGWQWQTMVTYENAVMKVVIQNNSSKAIEMDKAGLDLLSKTIYEVVASDPNKQNGDEWEFPIPLQNGGVMQINVKLIKWKGLKADPPPKPPYSNRDMAI